MPEYVKVSYAVLPDTVPSGKKPCGEKPHVELLLITVKTVFCPCLDGCDGISHGIVLVEVLSVFLKI